MTDGLAWCRDMLPLVSRTFALGIQSLPQPFEPWVTTAYLLCRIADTVEDAPDVPWVDRREMFLDFDTALLGGSAAGLEKQVHRLPPGNDRDLCAQTSTLLALMDTFPPEVQQSLRKWAGEMTYGMATYARRHTSGTLTMLQDAADLERYCWYVAGTVGHLLTDLFIAGFPELEERERDLRRRATGFGLLLQMTNIVKDVTDDWERNWCFIPQTLQQDAGVSPGGLLDPDQRAQAMAAVDAVNHMGRTHFADALAYCAALPEDAEACRRFCLLPMLIARRTLDLALSNPATVTPGEPVKVTREIVGEEVARTEQLLGDNLGLAELAASWAD